jgi:hypothetical protein
MTERQKQEALDSIATRIARAEYRGLRATAQSWRELYTTVALRPAGEIVMGTQLFGGTVEKVSVTRVC